jgi:predicted alpha/beta-hydrolase family hydrolase
MAQGWSAVEVLGEPGLHEDPLAWERESAEHALEAAGAARIAVIGKSLASRLADLVNERDLPAVWLTPLLTDPLTADALAWVRRPTLLVGGTADELWDAQAIPDNSQLEALEIDGADHALQVRGDPARSLDALGQMTHAVAQLLTRVGTGPR